MKTIFTWTAAITLTLATLAFAAVPKTINYQGYLKNAATGAPASGMVNMTFSLYSSATSRNNPVWREPAKQVSVANGIYSTTVGSTANPITAPFDVPYYLGITVNGTELPSQPLSSVPYAQRAAVADAVPASAITTGSLTGAMLADGTITAGKLASGVVPSWQNITTATTAAVNSGYVTSGATPVEVTLPATAAVGDTISITGAGSGGWTITTSGGQTIFSSTPGMSAVGTFWTPRPDSGARTWESIASSSDGSKLAAAPYGGQIHTSTDAGVTWTARGFANVWMSVASSSDGVNLVAVAQGNTIFTSGDSGASWTEHNYYGNWRGVTSSADGVKLAAVIAGNFIYTSGDAGATWINQQTTGGLQWLSIASSADGTKLVAGTGGGAGQLYTSSDSGVSWTPQASPIGKEYRAVASSADGVKLAAVAQGGQIYTSSDAGVTWTARESNRQWFAITSSADGTRLAATTFPGQIYTSTDSGVTWTARESSRQWSSIAASADGTRLAAADLNGIIYTSVEGVINSIVGGPRDTIQLQYIGNNQYQVTSYQPSAATTTTGVADGSITTATLSDGAVTDAKITGPISAVKLASHTHAAGDITTGALAIANGGTGASSQPAAANNILPAQSGNSGKVLGTDGGNASWVALPATQDARFGTNTNWAVAGGGRDCNIGEIILTAGAVANGVPANGQTLAIAANTALFSLLGTTYGGDGKTTFALPDLRGVAPNGLTYSICDFGIYPSRR